MALCFVPSHAVLTRCNRMSIKYWLSSLPTHCHPKFSLSSEIPSSLQVIIVFSLSDSVHVCGVPLLLIISCLPEKIKGNSEATTVGWSEGRGKRKKKKSQGERNYGNLQCKTSIAAKNVFVSLAWQEHNVQAALHEWCTGAKKKRSSLKTDLQTETKSSWQADLFWTLMSA